MSTSKITVKSPCDQDFESMREEGKRRFCEACSCHVHDFSKMTRDEALDVIARAKGQRICARIRRRRGEAVFLPSRLERQRRGAARLVATAAVIAAPFLAGCPEGTSPPHVASAVAPVPQLLPGAGVAPSEAMRLGERRTPRTTRSALPIVDDHDYDLVEGEIDFEPMTQRESARFKNVLRSIGPHRITRDGSNED